MKNSFYTFILITSVVLISAVAFEPQLFNQAFAFFGLRNESVGQSDEPSVKPHFPITPLPNDMRQPVIPAVLQDETPSPSFSGTEFVHSGQPQQAGYMTDATSGYSVHQMSLEGNFPPEGFPVTQVSDGLPGSAATFSSHGNGSPVIPTIELPPPFQASSFPSDSSSVSSSMPLMNIPPSPLGLPTHPIDPPFSRPGADSDNSYSSGSSFTPTPLPTQQIGTPPALPPIQYTTEHPQNTVSRGSDMVSVPEISESQYPQPTPQASSINYQTSVSSAASSATSATMIPGISVNSHDLQVESKIAELEFVSGAGVLAKVGTELILLCDVMPEVRMRMETIVKERNIPENEKEQFYKEAEKQLLPNILEQKIVFTVYYLDAKTSLPKEQFAQIEASIRTEYDRVEIGRLMEQHEVSTRVELERKLQSYGSSLEREKKDFVRIYLGRVWLSQSANVQESSLITQQDMIDYYEQHKEEKFRHEARACWEELAVSFSQVPDENQAWNMIAEMGNRVLKGESFAEVAKKHSHGITASSGGAWDWCQPGSLRSEMIDHAIFTLPPGRLSTIIQDDTGFHIIRVVEREGIRYTPFEKVHNELRKGIQEERIENNRKKYDETVFKKIPISISHKVDHRFFSEEFQDRITSAQ